MTIDLLELEGLRLLTPIAEVISQCGTRGWGHNLKPESTLGTVLLDLPVDSALCTFDGGVLIQIQVTYQGAQPEHVAAAREGLRTTQVEVIAMWGGFSEDLQVARYGDDAATTVTAVHVGRMSNKAEVERLFATFGRGLKVPS